DEGARHSSPRLDGVRKYAGDVDLRLEMKVAADGVSHPGKSALDPQAWRVDRAGGEHDEPALYLDSIATFGVPGYDYDDAARAITLARDGVDHRVRDHHGSEPTGFRNERRREVALLTVATAERAVTAADTTDAVVPRPE